MKELKATKSILVAIKHTNILCNIFNMPIKKEMIFLLFNKERSHQRICQKGHQRMDILISQ